MTVDPPHVFVVSEIRDRVLRRVHGYFASLAGSFAYCETEERKKPLVDSVRFELFAAPGGHQWLIHEFYGPEDDWPQTSDLVISQHQVIPDASAAAPADRSTVLRQAADAAEGVGIRLHREHHVERSNGAYDVMNVLTALAREAMEESLRQDGFGAEEISNMLPAGVTPVEDLASPGNPTQLRWGLNDVMYGDDGTVTVLLSGRDREPYWLELDPEHAAVLREDLARSDGPASTPNRATVLRDAEEDDRG